MSTRSTCVAVVLGVLSACGSGAPIPTDGGADAGPEVTTSIDGIVRSFAMGSGETPIAGARICVLDRPDIACTTSAADGTFSLAGVPADVPGAIRVDAEAHVSAIIPGVIPAGLRPTPFIDMIPDATLEAGAAPLGITYPLGDTGLMTLYARELAGAHPYLAGATMDLETGTATGIFYPGPDESIDPTLTETSTAGWALAANVSVGTVTVRYGPPAMHCDTAIWGWPRDDGAIDVPIRAGADTYVLSWCAP
jgi:hypothetical protein